MSVPLKLNLQSPVFSDGFQIPKDYTADGANASPPLRWSDPPEGTKSFALVVDDPDAPRGTFVHWVLFNLPADARELSPGVPQTPSLPGGARQRPAFTTCHYRPPTGEKAQASALSTWRREPSGSPSRRRQRESATSCSAPGWSCPRPSRR